MLVDDRYWLRPSMDILWTRFNLVTNLVVIILEYKYIDLEDWFVIEVRDSYFMYSIVRRIVW